MSEPNSDLQSKICRAVRALLIEQGAGTPENTHADLDSTSRTLPITSIGVGDGVPFDGPGNWQFPTVAVILKDAAVVQPDETNADAPRIAANLRATGIYNALNRSDDEHTLSYTAAELTRLGRLLAVDTSGGADANEVQRAADNADMAEFTVLWWEAALMGSASKSETEGGTWWTRELGFGCVACNNVL